MVPRPDAEVAKMQNQTHFAFGGVLDHMLGPLGVAMPITGYKNALGFDGERIAVMQLAATAGQRFSLPRTVVIGSGQLSQRRPNRFRNRSSAETMGP